VLGNLTIDIDRYWGTSNPYPEQTTTNLQYLTLNQSINDFVNFAQNVVLPFDTGRTSAPSLAVRIRTDEILPRTYLANTNSSRGYGWVVPTQVL
jgi:hypothetical protein